MFTPVSCPNRLSDTGTAQAIDKRTWYGRIMPHLTANPELYIDTIWTSITAQG